MSRALAVCLLLIVVGFAFGLRPDWNELVPVVIAAAVIIGLASLAMKLLFGGMFR
jgi:hypothetical protein